MANFCCSIETEPRTLNQGQLNYAREIAVDIVQKNEPDEASSIFKETLTQIQGLKAPPVVGIKETVVVVVPDANPPHKAVETNCQCSSSALAMESSPEECRVKEPLSAPF
ncbi:hypothetical protein DH2020_013279 [Rehmannia glutinosa]|uniref:Uncharacterized protein n=1 Tax=Rehmannia glutinosa TaxID=99300 RepID=A0ABR0X5E6_REHGL